MMINEVAGMNDTWKTLKQKQKLRITEIIFQIVCDVYKETGQMPSADQYEMLARKVYLRCNSGKLAFEDLLPVFVKKQARFAERIATHGLPVPKPAKVKKSEAEKLAIKRKNRQRRKEKQKQQEYTKISMEQDDTFCCIVGYTSGGAPYGLQWWEVGIDPELPFDEKVRLYESGEFD